MSVNMIRYTFAHHLDDVVAVAADGTDIVALRTDFENLVMSHGHTLGDEVPPNFVDILRGAGC